MGVRVGIPRALLYYDYFLLWSTFLENMGVEIVVSQKTNKKIINNGIKSAVDDSCLPVKVFLGHVLDLTAKKVDYIFLPRYISVEPRRFMCPKLMGLPDMVKQLLPGIPPTLVVDMDARKSGGDLPVEILRLGRLFTFNPWKIRLAYKTAIAKQKKFKKRILEGLTPDQIFLEKSLSDRKQTIAEEKNIPGDNTLKIGLLGHAYNLFDNYLNMNIQQKLNEMDVLVLTSKMFTEEQMNSGLKRLEKDIFWTFGRETIGSAFYLLQNKMIHGVILLVSFACGPDSIIMDIVERAYKREGVPCLTLVLDEHSGEGGVITRLEAFMEMLKWREQRDESYLSSHGEPLDCPESPV
jgi:predicted nucleotide-binding protein (sugar kinase/HSP70/actin superfamily)